MKRLPMTLPCSHYRYDGKRHGCELLGECVPIQQGPDLTGCPSFHNPRHKATKTPKAKSPTKAEARPPCGNLGAATGDTVTCPTCTGNVQLKVFTCTEHGTCTIGKKAPGVACCDGCNSYRKPDSIRPVSSMTVDLPGHYNCALLEWHGQTLLASRLDRGGKAGVYLSELFEGRPLWTYELEMHHDGKRITAEDPRLFVHQGRLHIAFHTYNGKASSIAVAELSHDLQVERVWLPQYAERNSWEKNWCFFEEDGALYSLYSINPHVVLVHAGGHVHKAFQQSHSFRWPMHMRGGAICRVGDEYYHWFHTTKQTNKHYLYTMGLYTFSAKPPFKPLRAIADPVFVPVDKERPIGFNKSVIFPCGADLQNGQWRVSVGIHDAECRIIAFDAADIEKRLVKI